MRRRSVILVVVLALLVAGVAGCGEEEEREVTAGFTASPTFGSPPLAVQFADESLGDITGWEWDFGDGGTSTEQSPLHTYSSVGEYTVSVTVTGPDGSDTETKTSYIEVGEIIAGFTASPTSGSRPLQVQFTDESTGDIAGWEWDFGDGVTGTEQSPSHTYDAVGEYTVSLEVTGPAGSDTETKDNYVDVVEAEFTLKIGLVGSLSGPYAASIAPVVELIQQYFDYINEVEGGYDTVDGKVKIDYITMDDEYQATTGAEVYKELRDTHDVPLQIWIGETTLAGVMDQLANDKIVVLTSVATTPDAYVPPGWVFALRPLTDYFAGFVKWIIDEDWLGPGMPKVGYFGPESGFALADKINFDWVEDQGIEIVDRWCSFTDLTYTPHLQAFIDAEVDYLYCNLPVSQAAILANDADALGLRDYMKICLSTVCEPYLLRSVVGGDKIKDWYRLNFCNFWIENGGAVQRSRMMQEWAKGEGNYDPKEGNTPLEYTIIIGEAVAKIVEQSGFEGIDGQAFYDVLQTMTDVDTMDSADQAGFSTTSRIFVNRTRMGIITKDAYLAISGWFDMPRVFEGGGVPLE